jgi:hypothetical protein
MSLKINRDWRQWKNENNDKRAPRVVVGSEEGSGVSQTSRLSDEDIQKKNFKIKRVPNSKLNSKSNKIYDAGKELYVNNKLVYKKGKTQKYDGVEIYNAETNLSKRLNDAYKEKRNKDTDEQERIQQQIDAMNQRIENLYDFESQLGMSIYSDEESDNEENKQSGNQTFKHNEYSAKSLGITYFKSRNRRYGTEFANLIAKLAEDNTGADIQGDEFWDEHLLAERVVTRQSINKCKKDRIKERIILMLDTSPSCKSVASFYGLIAQLAAKYDDIEIYDAPNGRIVHKYCKRTKDFVPIWNSDDIENRAYDWKYLKNRTVLLFSDTDCLPILEKNLNTNNIIFMCRHEVDERRHSMRDMDKKLKDFGNTVYYNVKTPDKLVEVIKKLK